MENSNKSAQDILDARLAEIAQRRNQDDLLPAPAVAGKAVQSKSHLSPNRHPTRDFFVIDVFDASLKDDMASMEHPLFAMKAGDTRTRIYEHNGNTVTVSPNVVGCATIHDKDVWIYCISALVAAKNKGEKISRSVRFTVYDLLVSTNKPLGGDGYRRLREALDRLAGTRIITNIATGGRTTRRNFGLLDDVKIVYEDEDDDKSPMVEVEVTLPDWLFRSIEARQVKTISPDYFRIRKPLDRRIYELCAKHCGEQREWAVSLELLHKKSGSTATLREFRRAVKSLVDGNELPDYRLSYDAKRDMLKVRNRNITKLVGSLKSGK